MTTVNHIKPLVIFDLNGTLLYRARARKDKYSIDVPATAKMTGRIRGRNVYLRPFVEEVLNSDKYDYAIWTSANPENANAMYDLLPNCQRAQFVWNRSFCTANPNGEKSWSVFKDLDRIDKTKYPNFLLVDDTDEKLYRHHKMHHLQIPEYICEENDDILKFLRIYLDNLSEDQDNYVQFMENLSFDDFLKQQTHM